MICVSAIGGIFLRYARLLKRDINLVLTATYWPLLDIVIWGYLGSWIQKNQTATQFQNYETVALLGILLWQAVGRSSNIISFAFMEELWSNNLVNIFSLPLRITDWIVGILLWYAFMILLTCSASMLVIALLYNVAMSTILTTFLTFFPPLFFCGIWIGFMCLQIVALLGKRGIELSFVVAWFFLPFSGAYYPIDVLPSWGQTISKFLPMSYVFQAMRGQLMYQQDPTPLLVIGYLLSILYAVTAIALFIYCFNRSKEKGLARLAD